MSRLRYAFTMLELIFVIVVIGILAHFGVELLSNTYQNFIFTKVNNDLQSRSGSAVEFIAKRLENRITGSVSAVNAAGGRTYLLGGVAPNVPTFEWIATDIDGFRGTNQPLWSGVIDLQNSNANLLVSPGSSFATLTNRISDLSNGGTNLNSAALYFIDSPLAANNPWGFAGAIGDQNSNIHPINMVGGSNTQLVPSVGSFANVEVSEYYKLVWTAYAVALENYNAGTNMGELAFYYDYQPWLGETYLQNGTRTVLARNVSTFRFRAEGSLIKIQVCANTNLVENYALCKEKTVF
ncbi:type II secretion system protein [Sulfurimonas sp.]|uniref:type II secretion system protein n=1 Tax=Sulfurimonas sp. TaxID=2022749 RepID=UPI003D0FB89F